MRSEAQKRADKKYIESGKCQYKTISTRLHSDQFKRIQVAAEKANLTVSKFMLLSALHCINDDIQFNKSEDK